MSAANAMGRMWATEPTVVGLARSEPGYASLAQVEAAVRQAIGSLGLPPGFVHPGDRVVVKPNWVKQNDERHPGPGHWEHIVTHPSVVEAVVRWAAEQLCGEGSVTICDAPLTDSSFAKLREYCSLDAMLARCRRDFPGVHIDILDLRPEEWLTRDGVTVATTKLPGDPAGGTLVRLDDASELAGYPGCGRLYGANYDIAETNRHHTGDRHEYLLCRTPMDADVFINVPKLKTHRKVGVTCALKNLVGVNEDKNWLPHHTEGTPATGGDQFPADTARARLEHAWMGAVKARLRHHLALSRAFVPAKAVGRLFFGGSLQVVRSGNWYGNDTCWRMVHDLNKCFFHFDGSGVRRTAPRRYLAVVDGIIAGEGSGPIAADPIDCGVVIAGTHPVAVDCTAATLMGFVWERVPLLHQAFMLEGLGYVPFAAQDIRVVSDNADWHGPLAGMTGTFHFRPHFGWVGAIEAVPTEQPA